MGGNRPSGGWGGAIESHLTFDDPYSQNHGGSWHSHGDGHGNHAHDDWSSHSGNVGQNAGSENTGQSIASTTQTGDQAGSGAGAGTETSTPATSAAATSPYASIFQQLATDQQELAQLSADLQSMFSQELGGSGTESQSTAPAAAESTKAAAGSDTTTNGGTTGSEVNTAPVASVSSQPGVEASTTQPTNDSQPTSAPVETAPTQTASGDSQPASVAVGSTLTSPEVANGAPANTTSDGTPASANTSSTANAAGITVATSTSDSTTTDSGATTPRTPGTPFASNSVFNQPLGSGAQWQPNAQLDNAGVYINTVGNYNENIYTSTASDPLVTVTNDAAAGGTPGTFEVNIPAGAVPAGGNDKTFTVDNTATGTWDSFGGFTWTGPNTATVSQGSDEPINGSGITQASSDWDEGVGTLTQADLSAGTIDHMLRVELPTTMLESYDSSNTNNLAPYAWPQTAEDGFANNGDGGPAYSGTVPYGVTIGIPAGTPEPTDVADNAGANMLWNALQDHGAMVRDSGGNDNNVVFQTDQNVNPNDPLIQGMDQYGSEIMAATQILTNQGPNSVNGGGTPIVPLDAPIST